MVPNTLFMLRPGLRAAFRAPRQLGRRGYASPSQPSLQERIATASDRPWQMAAVAVALPGVMYLRKGSTPKTSNPGQTRALHTESSKKAPKVEAKAEPSLSTPSSAA